MIMKFYVEGLSKALGQKIRWLMFYEIIKNPGISVTELAEKLKLTQEAVSKHLKILEEAKLVKWKYKQSGKGAPSKLLYPSYRGLVEEYLKIKGARNVQLTDEDAEILDSFFFNEKARELYIKKMEYFIKNVSRFDPLLFVAINMIEYENELKSLVEKYKELKKLYAKAGEVLSKYYKNVSKKSS